MKKISLLFVLFILTFTFNVNAQDLAKQVIGKWAAFDIKVVDLQGKPAKLTPQLKKELADAKQMFAGKEPLAFEFKGDKMNMIPAQGEDKAYTIKDGKLSVEGDESMQTAPIAIVKGNLEMAPMPAQDGKIFMIIFKKQK